MTSHPFFTLHLRPGMACDATVTAIHRVGSVGLEVKPGVGAFLPENMVRGLDLKVGDRVRAVVSRINTPIKRIDLTGPVQRIEAAVPPEPQAPAVAVDPCPLAASVNVGDRDLIAVDVANVVLSVPPAYRATVLPLLERELRAKGYRPVFFLEGVVFVRLKVAGELHAVEAISAWLTHNSSPVVRVGSATGGDLSLLLYAKHARAEVLTNDRFRDHPEATGLPRHGFVLFDGVPGIAPTLMVPTLGITVTLTASQAAA